jgi:1-phosphatidylinositol phosphodiesterase
MSLTAFGVSAAIAFAPSDENLAATSFDAKPRDCTTQKYSRWMSRLPDSVLISQLSLPGTHNSCALHDGLSFGFAKCQSWQLADQLKSGIRFIDIRCRHVDDRFLIYHGVISQRMTFEELRDVCQNFLREHPSECIVMSIKKESTAERTTRSFAETFSDATKDDEKLWYISREVPQLREVRNHIVLVDRVGTLGGLNWDGMQRQDEYMAPLKLKEQLIRAQFDQAITVENNQWFINFCSGTVPGRLLTPKKYAAKSNQFTLDILNQELIEKPIRLGTIVMDFPGEDLIERIVETNFAEKKVN